MKTATNQMSGTLDQTNRTVKALEESFALAARSITPPSLNIDPSVGVWTAHVEEYKLDPAFRGTVAEWITKSKSKTVSKIGKRPAVLAKVVYQHGVLGVYTLNVICGNDAMDRTMGETLVTEARFDVYSISDVTSVTFLGDSLPSVEHKHFGPRKWLHVSNEVAVAIAAKLS